MNGELYASDGLIARASGPWAKIKLDRLENYASTVTTALRDSMWHGLAFVDLMAGPGMCVDELSNEEFEGSTLRALSTRFPFSKVIAIERDAANVDALRHRVERHPRKTSALIKCLDCNSRDAVDLVNAETAGHLTLVFVDLLGTEVGMETVRKLAQRPKGIDFVFTWPEMDVVRNRGQLHEQADRWTRFFGTDQWRQISEAHGPQTRLIRLRSL